MYWIDKSELPEQQPDSVARLLIYLETTKRPAMRGTKPRRSRIGFGSWTLMRNSGESWMKTSCEAWFCIGEGWVWGTTGPALKFSFNGGTVAMGFAEERHWLSASFGLFVEDQFTGVGLLMPL